MNASDDTAANNLLVLRLYVAGESPNSLRALANLDSICREHLAARHTLEIVDVLEQPLRALEDGIIVTPILLKVSPAPRRKLIGDLSDTHAVLLALGAPRKLQERPAS